MHRERRGEGEHLPLAARELVAASVEQGLHAKEVAGLGHAAAHLALGEAEVLEAEGHLVPDRVADDLVVGTLEDEAHELRGRLG